MPAQATIIGPGILISAEDELGHSSSYQAEGTWVGEEYVWSLNEPFDFFDNNIYLGTLMDGSYSWYLEDPVAGISFTATAGGTDTTFMLSSATVSFPAITNPIGSLNASITITDNGSNGVQFSGILGSGSAANLALYNNPPGTSFGELFSSTLAAGPGGSLSTNGAVGPTAILGSIDSIQNQWGFTLSALDEASGSSTFTVLPQEAPIPEPSTILLLGTGLLGVVGIARRRKS